MKSEFASANLTAGQLNAIVKKLGGYKGALRFLRGETSVTERKWREQDGIIYFSVTSDGTTGQEWIDRFEKTGFRISDNAKSVLLSDDFKPSSGLTTEIAVLKSMFFMNKNRITEEIRAYAAEYGFSAPNAEVACLIHKMFTDNEIEEAMGLWCIVVMHEPSNHSDDVLVLLHAYGDGSRLTTSHNNQRSWWGRGHGFVFMRSQVSVS